MKPPTPETTSDPGPFWSAVQEALDRRRDPLEDPDVLAILLVRPELLEELEDLLDSLERLEGAPLPPTVPAAPAPQLGPALAAGLLAVCLLPGLLRRGAREASAPAGRISHLVLTVATPEGSSRIRFRGDTAVEQTVERHLDLAPDPALSSPISSSAPAPRGLSLSISTRTLEP